MRQVGATPCCSFSCCGAWAVAAWASVFVVHRLSCPAACGVLASVQELNRCSLHWQGLLSHWTTREVQENVFLKKQTFILHFLNLYSVKLTCVCMKVVSGRSCSVVSDSLHPHGLYSPWNSPYQNTGVGSCSFLQGIFPTQGSNPGLLHCRRMLYQLSHKGSPVCHVCIYN